MNDVVAATRGGARSARDVFPTWTAPALGCAALVAAAAIIGASANAPNDVSNALLRASLVAAPLAAAIYASQTQQHRRVAPWFVAVGGVSFLTTLADTSDPVLYTVGRTAGWGMEILLVAAVLAIPALGRKDAADRRLVWAMAAVVATCYLPLLVLSGRLPVPTPWTSCRTDCPVSPLALFPHPPSAVALLPALGSVLVLVIMGFVIVRLQRHIVAATAVQRALLVPILVAAMVRAGLVASAITWRTVAPNDELVNLGSILIGWATPLLAVAFLIGVVRARLRAEFTLRHLAVEVQHGPTFPDLERSLVRALGDESVTFAVLEGDDDGHRWANARGEWITKPGFDPDRRTAFVRDRNGTLIAAISRDISPADCPELVASAGAIIGASLENARLSKQAATVEADLRRSRARLVTVADHERHRIERDLHDGAQQRLVALRIDLGLAGDLVHTDPDACAARLHVLEQSVDEALDELRALAQGVCPPMLTDRGIADALRAVVPRCPVPTRLHANGVGRYPNEIETAIYFCVLEALQNVAKHAIDAQHATVYVGETNRGLSFRIADDGRGARNESAEAGTGTGLINMHDRIAAVGGDLKVSFTDGRGTDVTGHVPLPSEPLALPVQGR